MACLILEHQQSLLWESFCLSFNWIWLGYSWMEDRRVEEYGMDDLWISGSCNRLDDGVHGMLWKSCRFEMEWQIMSSTSYEQELNHGGNHLIKAKAMQWPVVSTQKLVLPCHSSSTCSNPKVETIQLWWWNMLLSMQKKISTTWMNLESTQSERASHKNIWNGIVFGVPLNMLFPK
jgi:hypothetical protein